MGRKSKGLRTVNPTSERALASWRKTIRYAIAASTLPREITEALWADRERGLTWGQLAQKYGRSRNSVAGLLWREGRRRKGLQPSPHHHRVAQEQQPRKTVSLPIVRWGKD